MRGTFGLRVCEPNILPEALSSLVNILKFAAVLTVIFAMMNSPALSETVSVSSDPAAPGDESGICRYFDMGDIVRHGHSVRQSFLGLPFAQPEYDRRRGRAMAKRIFAMFDYNRSKLQSRIADLRCEKRQNVVLTFQTTTDGPEQRIALLYELWLFFSQDRGGELHTACFGSNSNHFNPRPDWTPGCWDRNGRRKPPPS